MPRPTRKRDNSPKPHPVKTPGVGPSETQTFLFNIVAGDAFCSFQRPIPRLFVPENILKILEVSTKLSIDIDHLLEMRPYKESWQNCYTDEECRALLAFLRAIGFDSITYPDSIPVYPALPEQLDTCITELTVLQPYSNCRVVNFYCSSVCGIVNDKVVDAVGEYLIGEFCDHNTRAAFAESYMIPLAETVAQDWKDILAKREATKTNK
jgi:hypothetical protein